ncbi:hypothetical protein QBC36DRAFT_382600 [Triangularia setosa]|uniref:Uncharacterized protein n=1 Tax=Triangularia setosa TaxID=2587417 RepID=A0AAN6VY63_9PEZI|nr:hypothetical protein QBC36DRAFT_382600 [Podospora setosa]
MGWWNSIVDGVGSAVNWIKSNSGTIGAAASVIAKIAGAVAQDDDDPVAQLFPNFTKAAQKLNELAKGGANAKLKEVLNSIPEYSMNDRMVNLQTAEATLLADSTFLWLDPAPLNRDGQPNKGLVQDIGKMLAQSSFSTVLTSSGEGKRKGSRSLDVALAIGQAIFANMGTGAEQANDDGIVLAPFDISYDDVGCRITGCHAYYQIPLGQTGANSAWHAALAMSQTTTENYRKYEFARTRDVFFTQPIRTDNGNPQWLVTMSVPWEESVSAYTLSKGLLGELTSNDIIQDGWHLHYHSLDGTDQHIKVQCPDGHTPAQARGLVRECIKKVLKNSGMLVSASTSPYLTPDIHITMSVLKPGDSRS